MSTNTVTVPSLSLQTQSILADPGVQALVDRKARQISRLPGYCAEDRADLAQELRSRLSQSIEDYDPNRSSLYPYIKTRVNQQTCNILRRGRACKRSGGQVASLNANIEVDGIGKTELAQTISDQDVDRRLGRERRLSEEELSDLRMDMSAFIATLPKKFQEVLRLRQDMTIAEIARDLGIARTTLNDWMVQIRQLFEEAGFERYLDS